MNLENIFLENYGLKNTGKKLKNFIKEIYPELQDCNYVYFPPS